MAVLNAVNVGSQNLSAGDLLSFATNTVTGGCGITHLDGGTTITIKRAGVYLVSVSADIDPTAAGVFNLQLLNKGVSVRGARAGFAGTIGNTQNVSFTTLVRVLNSCAGVIDNSADLQVQFLTSAGLVTNASISVVKVA